MLVELMMHAPLFLSRLFVCIVCFASCFYLSLLFCLFMVCVLLFCFVVVSFFSVLVLF